jgi:hypothetical protein
MNIKLRKVDDVKKNILPKGVVTVVFNEQVVFVRRIAGRFVPLPVEEQEILKKKHVV